MQRILFVFAVAILFAACDTAQTPELSYPVNPNRLIVDQPEAFEELSGLSPQESFVAKQGTSGVRVEPLPEPLLE